MDGNPRGVATQDIHACQKPVQIQALPLLHHPGGNCSACFLGVSQDLLRALEPELKDFVPQTAITHFGVLNGLFCGTHSQEDIDGAWRVLCCFKDALWCARKRLIHQRERMSIEDCRRLVHSLLRDYHLMDFKEEEEV